MDKYCLELSGEELKTLNTLLEFSLWEILRQTKKFGTYDFDLKECYWNYRCTCNDIRERIKEL